MFVYNLRCHPIQLVEFYGNFYQYTKRKPYDKESYFIKITTVHFYYLQPVYIFIENLNKKLSTVTYTRSTIGPIVKRNAPKIALYTIFKGSFRK